MRHLRSFLVMVTLVCLVARASASEQELVKGTIEGLAGIAKAVCSNNPNISACHPSNCSTDGTTQPVGGSVGDAASLFIIHFSFLQDKYKELLLENEMLKGENQRMSRKLKALEDLIVSEANLTSKSLAVLEESLNLDPEHPFLYSPFAFFLRPTDCSDHLLLGAIESGIYEVYPFKCKCSEPLKVWCDMETEGGGWTVFLQRQVQEIREDFNRSWDEYAAGFGNLSGEFYLGNDILHLLTSSRFYSLRADFELSDGPTKFSEWDSFRVGGRRSKYKLDVDGFQDHSMTKDCFANSNRAFSTADYDNDNSYSNCAFDHLSGWWYNNCGFTPGNVENGYVEPNCPYVSNGADKAMKLAKLQLKVRPNVCGQQIDLAYYNKHSCRDHNTLQGQGPSG